MKKMLAVVCLGAFIAAPMLHAEYVPPPIPEGMGAKVEIGPEVDVSAVDRSYLTAPDVVTMKKPLYQAKSILRSVIWHPDGKHLFFNDLESIYLIPASGGNPRLLFESKYFHSFEGKRYVITQSLWSLVGVTPDGRSLYFTRRQIGEGSGATITINVHDSGWGCSVSGGAWALERLDLETGTVSTVSIIGSQFASLSSTGKYVAFQDKDSSATLILDTASNESWTVSSVGFCSGFMQDSYILYSYNSGLLRMPIRGGEATRAVASGGGLVSIQDIDCSPDGRWSLVSGSNGERTSNTAVNHSYTKNDIKLCAFNLDTGEVSDALPVSKTIDPSSARFSPDGSRFCYVFRNWEGEGGHNEWHLYVKDFPPAKETGGSQLSVFAAAPVGFALTGNYPNPFNPSTTISFTLPSPGAVNLAIYDIAGRKVRDLASGSLPAGFHSVTWDGRDTNGKSVSSGVYISRLTQGERTVSRRMTLMK
jgi:hypothetical protein